MSKKGGHHGGAWKVAYADFVTAMMALFMVLWLAAQDQKIKEAIERAFRNPFVSVTKGGTGLLDTKAERARMSKGLGSGTGASHNEVALLRRLHQRLSTSLIQLDEKDDDAEQTVQFDLEDEGLRISVFDRNRHPIFEHGSSKLTKYGSFILSTLAWEIARYPQFAIELEGHTEAGHEVERADYDNWELSSDRANTARRMLVRFDVKSAQVKKVAGFADTIPLPQRKPDDPSNRRIGILLRPDRTNG